MTQPTKLTLLSRRYCHLCHDMERALARLSAELGIEVEVVDVDADAALESRYDELVPVLLHNGRELCHYFLDVAKVRDYLSEIR
ncbi:MAG TPA: glutaredoxin family protein [Accumulibacter sp.]|uniref:glutaredoxin family protein n=1 Tax=Accumulibacter sp. TaxID=2053492 RepID=UPI000EE56906|nr:glutaredoxin family protein [Accumulibacter sp.]HCZ16873.1 thioredoxin family protein [Accumulibacter sp.]HRF72064.1 glutaredoxin family protein [Accumulibacter sp.]